LALICTFTSLAVTIPQIHAMVARFRHNLDQGSLSALKGLNVGVQVLALAVLAVSQGLRMRSSSNDESSDSLQY
jgi:hypothetical protein